MQILIAEESPKQDLIIGGMRFEPKKVAHNCLIFITNYAYYQYNRPTNPTTVTGKMQALPYIRKLIVLSIHEQGIV